MAPMVAGPTASGTRTPFGLNSGSSEGRKKKPAISLHSLHGIRPDSERVALCGVALDQLTLYLEWKFKVMGRKAIFHHLEGISNVPQAGFTRSKTQPRDKEGAVVREEREEGKKRVTRAMKDGWE